jgi:hypothetical protein
MNNSLAIYENFGQTKEIANALAASDLIPPHFQRKPSNILIALEFAYRNDVAPFAAMQSLFVVHGRVGMSAAMAISLARKHNVWKALKYKVVGSGDSLAVTAIATLHDDTEVDTTVTMQMANIAGWSKNAIYKSIPEQMLKYRAATFLIRSNFPEVLFGMQTVEELDDVESAKKAIPVKQVQKVITIDAVEQKPVDEKAWDEVNKPVAVNEPMERGIEDMRGELLEFLNSRSNLWFEALGKNRGTMIEAVEAERDISKMNAIMAKTLQYDKLATIALEKAKKDLIKEDNDIRNEVLND